MAVDERDRVQHYSRVDNDYDRDQISRLIASEKIIEASITIDYRGPVGFSTGSGDIQASGRKNNR